MTIKRFVGLILLMWPLGAMAGGFIYWVLVQMWPSNAAEVWQCIFPFALVGTIMFSMWMGSKLLDRPRK
jgi:hypothetical protein